MAIAFSPKSNKPLKVALVGNPNSGKTTLFNVLTGLNQQVGNYPGVTVDKKVGFCTISYSSGKQNIEIIDLPGTYSIFPKSDDERVAAEILSNPSNIDYPDITIIVADASNLKRSLLFASQVIDLQRPTILAVNMIDIAKQKGIEIDIEKLSQLLGIQIIPINSRKGEGINDLKTAISNVNLPLKKFLSDEDKSIENNQQNILRYQIITSILSECIKKSFSNSFITEKIDAIVLHKVGGYVFFLAILFIIFQTIFSWASYPMNLIDNFFLLLSKWGTTILPEGVLTALLVDGILPGLGGIIMFVPQIALLFAFVVILEDTGYMARVSFIMDKLLRKFGLNGKSVIPLLSGSACAVPAIMSARTITNWKERIITIMVTPLMSCSARLPVYTLLIALIIPDKKVFGILNLQGLTLMSLYLLGFFAAMSTAFVMQFLIKSKERSFFIMEMPIYKIPRWNAVGITIIEKVKVFIIDAGKIIIAISIVLWVLSSFGPKEKFQKIEEKYKTQEIVQNYSSEEIENKLAAEKLESSYAGIFGKKIEHIIQPLGFDWKIGIALITSFAAREVFVGTMATIYSIGDKSNTSTIREKMKNEINKETGEKVYSTAFAFSLMIFYCFAMQCMSTLAVVWRETKHWKWPLFQLLYMSGIAYLASFIVYQLMQ